MNHPIIKVSIINRPRSISKNESNSVKIDEQGPYHLEKNSKLTHWASRYKNGIRLINSRKEVPKQKLFPPVMISLKDFEKNHQSIRFYTEASEYIPYQKSNSKILQETKSFSEKNWIQMPEKKENISLLGKAIKIFSSINQKPSHDKAYSLFVKRGIKIGSFFKARGSHSKLEPWD